MVMSELTMEKGYTPGEMEFIFYFYPILSIPNHKKMNHPLSMNGTKLQIICLDVPQPNLHSAQ